MMGCLKNPRHEAFCNEFMRDRNASAAYVRAGYSRTGANGHAARLVANGSISDRIAELEADVIERLKLDVDALVRHYTEIATADIRELMSLRIGACRYCHGKGHAYQWRTEDEFNDAVETHNALPDADKSRVRMPSDRGGFGYRGNADPHRDCPMCDGEGIPRAVYAHSASLSRQAAKLFAGVKQTRYGFEIKTHSQIEALDALARHLNLFQKREVEKEKSVGDGIAEWIVNRINTVGSKPVLNRGALYDD